MIYSVVTIDIFLLASTQDYPATFRSALRVDPLLAGDRETIEKALRAAGYGTSVADARNYLNEWCDTMKPEYMMVSSDAKKLPQFRLAFQPDKQASLCSIIYHTTNRLGVHPA